MHRKLIELGFAIAAIISAFLPAGCRGRPNAGGGETGAAAEARKKSGQPGELSPAAYPAELKKDVPRKNKSATIPPASSAGDDSGEEASVKIEWGREATAGEVITMAQNGEIREIEWHVMPNILRAVASDGRVFFVRNENKGIDMRGMLIKEGVQIGKGGVEFRHVF